MSETKHGSFPLFLHADNCDHAEPPEPETDWSRDDPAWRAHDEYHADHQASSGSDGEPICILTQVGSSCPACTETERTERDLPSWEYVECRLATAGQEAHRG